MRKIRKKPKEFIPSIFTVMNMFIGFMAIPFFIWYVGIRRIVLTKFLRNGY